MCPAIIILQLSVEQNSLDLNFEIHYLERFFLRIATDPWVLCSRPQAEVPLTISWPTWATSICFQTCNDGTLDVADNYMTIFFILPATDKESLTSVAGLAFRLFMFFRQSVSFTFGTEEDACSGWNFLASLHFTLSSRSPVACACRELQASLNKTQLFSAEKFPMVLPNFSNHWVIHQVLVEHVDNQKRFLDDSYSLLFICSIPSSPLSFLDLEVIRAGWGTQVRHNCSVSQDRRGTDSLFVIPDHAA